MRKTTLIVAFMLLFAVVALAGQDGVRPSGVLKKVETKTVCMINEQAMGRDQIPVEIDGKTYYGCCEMCKKALASDASKRASVDPVSGKTVDKATAVIAAQEDGRVFYFENEENLNKHNAQYAKK